ncbi:hypothetical protein MauCBS54593_004074 [Microsporum audouinii]
MAILERVRLLARVSRPIGCLLVSSTYFLGIIHSGSYPELLPGILLALAFSFPLCLVLFGVNDVYDHDSDMLNPRKKDTWVDGARLQKADHQFVLSASKVASVLVLLLTLPAALRSPLVMGYMALTLLIAWTYSAPPLRLKERPVIDSFSNGIACWAAWACGYVCSGDKDLAHYSSDVLRNGLFIFFIGSAFHAMGAYTDQHTDADVGQKTIATALGSRLTLIFTTLCLMIGAVLVDPWSDIAICSVGISIIPLLLLVTCPTPSLQLAITRCFALSLVFGIPIWDLKTAYFIHRGWDPLRTW